MEKELFGQLMQSLKEAKAIARGDVAASRRFVLRAPDVRHVREGTGLSQSEFASLLGVSVRTLQNWEQHRRTPTGPAAALLKIVEAEPELALRTLHA